MNLERGCVSEDQHLNNRRAKQHGARPLVAEDLDEFFNQHLLESRQHNFSLGQPLVE